MDKCDVAIIGAGPYGLSAAAHLSQVKGLDVVLLGEPMSFWARHMPEEMCLRSPWAGSHLADPGNQFTLDSYRAVTGNHRLADPVPVRDFIQYGHWFQQHAALPADRRNVIRVDPAPEGYRLTFDAGAELQAQRVVVAAGIQPFAFSPPMFQGFPRSLVTHTSEQRGFAGFRGKRVLVIGGGQSALEAAVFLHEAGAQVEVLLRKSGLYWLERRRWMHSALFRRMFYGAGEIGPAGASLLIQRPALFRHLPRRIQRRWEERAMRPAVAHWLKARTQEITVRAERFPAVARVEGESLRVRLNDGSERCVEHVVLGTGYRVNIALYPFLGREVLAGIEMADGNPRLGAGLESSLPGLHFLGAPAARSFGPLMRFVAGAGFASRALHRHILQAGARRRVSRSSAAGLPFEPARLEADSPESFRRSW